MAMLDWLLGKAVEAPGIALDRESMLATTEAISTMRKPAFELKSYREMADEVKARVDEKADKLLGAYADAEAKAKSVCEQYAENLAARERRLNDAEAAFKQNRDLILAALRDAKQTALAKLLSDKMELWQ